MMTRYLASLFVLGCACAAIGMVPSSVTAQARGGQQWVLPRTPDGHPDLQGNWSNATITPMQRPRGQGPVLTREQVAAIEGRREQYIEDAAAVSDPDRGAPRAGGQFTGDLLFDAA